MSIPRGIEDKYEVLRKLAEGGMGAVYVVRHRLLDELRVIKVIRPHLAEKAHLRERFKREARAAIDLRHPHIAQIYDYEIDVEDGAYTVMELVDGLTLKEVLGAGPPPISFSLEVAAQTLQALGYLHRRGYLHRDVAPDNVMVTAGLDGRPWVKVIDLGLAKRFADELELTVSGMFVGKVRYAGPEQFSAPGKRPGPTSDLYAFGMVFYELLTGVPAIRGSSFEEVIAAHLTSKIRDFDETDPEGRVGPELRRLVLDLLRRDPTERPASAEEASARLAPLRSGEVPSYGEIERRVGAAGVAVRAAISAAGETGRTERRDDAEEIATTLEATRRLSDVRERKEAGSGSGPRKREGSRRLLVAAALAAAAIAGALALRQGAVLETLWLRDPSAVSVPAGTGVAAPGRLAVDARPWARVVRVEDADGREIPLDPLGVVTPAVLFLPAGGYVLTLEHLSGETREVPARVAPSSVSRVSAVLDESDADAYLAEVGLASAVAEAGRRP